MNDYYYIELIDKIYKIDIDLLSMNIDLCTIISSSNYRYQNINELLNEIQIFFSLELKDVEKFINTWLVGRVHLYDKITPDWLKNEKQFSKQHSILCIAKWMNYYSQFK